jgi:DNA polymerase-3 subunit beta
MKNFTISAQLVRSAMACQAKNDVRYYLDGFLLSASGHIVGTDGHILFKSDYTVTIEEEENQVLDVDSIIRIEGAIPLNSYTCEFLFKDDFSGHVQTDKGKLFPFVIVDGKYPDYNRVIPKAGRSEFSNGFACNVDLLARIQKVFGKDAVVDLEHSTENDSIRITCLKMESAVFVLMPCKSTLEYFSNRPVKKAA